MLRKNISVLIVIVFLNLNLFPAYAQEAVELTDCELDQIHAGGYSDVLLETASNAVAINDPFVLDAIVTGNNVAFKTNSENSENTDILKQLALGNNTLNSVSVEDSSQQNLSSLVNINAAGSVVPVQLNLTIIMNSTVGNVESNNNLNLNSYSTF